MVESIVNEAPVGLPVHERNDERSAIELSLLLEAIVRWSGYDFREYAPGTLKRRVSERMRAEGVESISGFQERVLHDNESLRRFVFSLSQTSNRLFRSPDYFKAFRERVVPFLRTYSFVRLWFPACSTGEDVYSVATILNEEGMLDRCMIYATDISDMALNQARAGTFAVGPLEEFANDYRLSGGGSTLSDICDYSEGVARFSGKLQEHIIFSTHSLANDASLNEFQCIVTRGVLPQFSKSLQYRVHNLMLQSLSRFGFLCLSSAESLHATPHEGAFRKVDEVFPIYRRMR
ncbi:MAG TPA: CheR family methyltransferase [Candidatus Baltobacteraceae bacterium]|jgi:chemotaxis protein methyltransferase CheR|nr:CheR family methyltransferase [Candidatus Baltobacteraceae bacterium]